MCFVQNAVFCSVDDELGLKVLNKYRAQTMWIPLKENKYMNQKRKFYEMQVNI